MVSRWCLNFIPTLWLNINQLIKLNQEGQTLFSEKCLNASTCIHFSTTAFIDWSVSFLCLFIYASVILQDFSAIKHSTLRPWRTVSERQRNWSSRFFGSSLSTLYLLTLPPGGVNWTLLSTEIALLPLWKHNVATSSCFM